MTRAVAHKKVMIKTAVLFGEDIMGSSFWRSESAVAYNSLYLPSLGCDMCATMLSLQEYEDTQCPVINAILPKNGYKQESGKSGSLRDVTVWRNMFGPLSHITRTQ
jgi:hypothetical protein